MLGSIFAAVGFKGIIYGLAALAISVTVWRVLDSYYDEGFEDARAAVEKINNRVADDMNAVARLIAECNSIEGYRWSQANDRCVEK